jgi:hypothetical protein
MLTLKPDRLSVTPTLYRTVPDGPLLNRKVYSYNATKALYDVCVDVTLGTWFRTDCKKSEKTKYHDAIMRHYNLSV